MANLSNINNKFLVTTGGNVGIGVTSPGAKLNIAGDVLINSGEYISWGTVGATSIEGSTASNKIQFRTGSADRMIINNTGVGIGTTSPDRSLDVEGTGMAIFGTGDYTELMLRGQVEGTGTVRNVGAFHLSIRGDVGGDNDDLKFLRFINGSYSGIAMQIQNTTATIIGNGIYTSSNSIKIFEAQRNGGAVKSDWSYDDATTDMSLGTSTAHSFSLKTGNTRALTIDTSGNVGIGTPSPASKFEVYGGGSGVNDVDRYIRFKASNGEKRFDFYVGGTGNASSLGMYTSDGTTKNVQISAGGTSYFNAGNVGIGTTSPIAPLHVLTPAVGGIDLTNISRTANNLVRFTNPQYSTSATMGLLLRVFPDSDARQGAGLLMTGGSDNSASNLSLFVSKDDGTSSNVSQSYSALHIAGNTGNVGIGTTSPSSKLEVESDQNSGFYSIFAKNISNGASAFVSKKWLNDDAAFGEIWRNSSNRSSAGQQALSFNMYNSADINFWSGTTHTMALVGDNVGIGTNSPSTPLMVNRASNSNEPGIYYDVTGGSSGSVGIGSTAAFGPFIVGNTLPNGNVRGAYSASRMLFNGGGFSFQTSDETSGARTFDDRMKIEIGGNVGIGTTSPDYGKLQIDQTSGNNLVLRKGTGYAAIAFGGVTNNEATFLLEGNASQGFRVYNGTVPAAPAYVMPVSPPPNLRVGVQVPSL